MTDLTKTIAPKSDQLNADDLIGKSITIRITKISLTTEPNQPIAINFENDSGKPFKPCKSMRRVLVTVWGGDGNAYVGRRITLFRDDEVQFGGMAVGGIRISHMSDINREITMALTATRASRKPYTVKPLPKNEVTADAVSVDFDINALLADGDEQAERGLDPLKQFWQALSPVQRNVLGGRVKIEEWKEIATRVDAAFADDFASSGHDAEKAPAPQRQAEAR